MKTTLGTPLTRADWGLALQWVMATTAGWVVGFAACEALKAILEFLAHPPTDGAVIGLSVGIAQWLVLRRRINRAGWWILASIVGFGVGKDVGDMVAQAVSVAAGLGLAGIVIGISLGLSQWLVLRRHVPDAHWWIWATAIAWTLGWSIINSVDNEGPGGSPGMAFVIGAIGAAAAGVVTAASLVWLLRRSRPT